MAKITSSGVTFILFLLLTSSQNLIAADEFKLFEYLKSSDAKMICYTPSQLDPRNPANQVNLKTSSIQADLEALRPAFDGLILYGYDTSVSPRIMYLAKKLGYRSVILGIWNPKDTKEINGTASLADAYADQLAVGILVGNEGLTFGRYEVEDLHFAAAHLKTVLKSNTPYATTEPMVGYQHEFLYEYGDFMAPNIHPVFDRPDFDAKAAAVWARAEALKMAQKSKLPILLKETGFPHAGKDKYTLASQTEFWKSYLADGKLATNKSNNNWVYYGVGFEAFDLPWKAEASGLPIESAWGLLSKDRKPYPVFKVWEEME